MERIFEKISFHLKNSPTFVELHLVRSRSMKKLNRQFRGKNKATDVLSFSSQQRNLLGSVVVDVDIAKRQARLYRHSLEREIQELFIHGVLHLLGFDHSTPKEAEVMRRFENYFGVILDKFSKRGKSKIRQHH
jgi:probable rRNA maturation factor